MSRLKLRSSVALVLFFIAAFSVEGWLLLKERQRANRATIVWSRKTAECDWLTKQTPALTARNEEAIAAELAEARQALAALRKTLQGPDAGWLNVRPPAKPLDAFFDIAGFVEKTRATAARAKVGFASNECFGFAAYSTEGPAMEFVPRVYRQRIIAQRLLDALIETHPVNLLAFQLEMPAAVVSKEKNGATDYFAFNPAFSFRQSDQLDTLAFRVEFSGQTATLRDFLNKIAGFPQPFVVRSVEVESMTASNSSPSSQAGPLVRQNFSKFAVIVELVLPNDAPVQTRL
jgi:Flp pilus assembly protein TadG